MELAIWTAYSRHDVVKAVLRDGHQLIIRIVLRLLVRCTQKNTEHARL